MKRLLGVDSRREGAMLLLSWLCLGVLFGVYFACISYFFYGEGALVPRFFWGLAFVAFLGGSLVAAEKLRFLWQYLLVSLGITALSALVFWTPFAMLPVGVVCFLRGRSRLQEEKEASSFDHPALGVGVLFILPFFCSALVDSPPMQKLVLFGAAAYILVWMAYRGLQRIHTYLYLNRGMGNLPGKRIFSMALWSLCGLLAVTGLLVFSALATDQSYLRIDPSLQQKSGQPIPIEIQAVSGGGGMEELSQLLGEEPIWQIPPIVNYIFTALLLGGLLCGVVVVVVYRMFRSFRRSFRDNQDEVQYLENSREEGEKAARKRRRLSPLDFSPRAQVRRKYRRAIRRASKEQPQPWQSPQEIEAAAGLRDPVLHEQYEEARYGTGAGD